MTSFRLALLVTLLALPAAAQDYACDNVPNPSGSGTTGFQYDPRKCGFDVGDLVVQRAPTVLQFQARVSDAKLPTGSGKFKTLVVQLLRSGQPICSETFKDILVRAYVLNLEIGRDMSCALDQVIAETTEPLAFQICLDGASSCLPPVPLASVPYAVKANVATRAEAARSANIAAVANYAHRLTTDRDLFLRTGATRLGLGYYDFASPLPAELPPQLLPVGTPNPTGGGFVRWVPMELSDRTASISLGGTFSASPKSSFGLSGPLLATSPPTTSPLDEVRLLATRVQLLGSTFVRGPDVTIASGGAHVSQAAHFYGPDLAATRLTVGGNLVIGRELTVQGDVDTYGKATVGGRLTVDGLLAVHTGATLVRGAATFGTGLVVMAMTTSGHVLALGTPLRVSDALHIGPVPPTGRGIRVQTSAVGGSELAIGSSGQTSGIRFRSRVIVEGLARFDSASFLGGTTANAGCGLGRAKRYDGVCVDVDECLQGTHTCGAQLGSTCIDQRSTDTPPYFECRCPVGTFATTTQCYSRKTHRRVFVTTGSFAGTSLGSITQLNDLCQQEASQGGATGLNADGRARFEALVALPTLSAIGRLTDGLAFVTLDGKVIAQSRADLLDGTIAAPIGVSRQGTAVTALPWTGIANSGTPHGATCLQNPGGQMTVAAPNQTVQWLGKAVAPCSESHPLICVER